MLAAFAAAAGWAAQARGGAAEWLLFVTAAAASAVAWLVPYLGAGRVVAERSVESERLEDGGDMTVRLTIRASRPMPLMWVAVTEEIRNLSATGENGLEARFVYMPGLRRTRTLTYTVSGLRRGELAFEAPMVVCGDLLGMTARTFYPACADRVTVRPRPPRGEEANPPGGAMPANAEDGGAGALATGAAAWQRDSRVRLQPGVNPQTRIYRPGDPLRLISWRAMARGLGMQTRLGSPEPPGEIALLLDISAASYAGSDRQFDAAVGRAAAAMREAIGSGRSATLLAGGRRWRVRAGDGAALIAAEEELGQLRASGDAKLGDWLASALAGLPRGADVVCITADPRSIDPLAGMSARAARAARKAARAGAKAGLAGSDKAAGSEGGAESGAILGARHFGSAEAQAITGAEPNGSAEPRADAKVGPAVAEKARARREGEAGLGYGGHAEAKRGRKSNRRAALSGADDPHGIARVAASAQWVRSRGGTFHLWLGLGNSGGQADAGQGRAGGMGVQVVPQKLTASYLAEPVVTAGREEGAVRHGRT